VLAVPTTAIRTGGQGGFGGQGRQGGQGGANVQGGQPVTNTLATQRVQGPSVLVMQNGQPQAVPVTEGLTVGDLTEVSGNLQEGDQVIVITTTRTTTGGAAGGPPGGFGGGGRPFGD